LACEAAPRPDARRHCRDHAGCGLVHGRISVELSVTSRYTGGSGITSTHIEPVAHAIPGGSASALLSASRGKDRRLRLSAPADSEGHRCTRVARVVARVDAIPRLRYGVHHEGDLH